MVKIYLDWTNKEFREAGDSIHPLNFEVSDEAWISYTRSMQMHESAMHRLREAFHNHVTGITDICPECESKDPNELLWPCNDGPNEWHENT